jgi:hypothetical protein
MLGIGWNSRQPLARGCGVYQAGDVLSTVFEFPLGDREAQITLPRAPQPKQLGAGLCLRVAGDLGKALDNPGLKKKDSSGSTKACEAEGAAVTNYLQSIYLRTVGQHKITDTPFSYLDRIEGLISQAQCRNGLVGLEAFGSTRGKGKSRNVPRGNRLLQIPSCSAADIDFLKRCTRHWDDGACVVFEAC